MHIDASAVHDILQNHLQIKNVCPPWTSQDILLSHANKIAEMLVANNDSSVEAPKSRSTEKRMITKFSGKRGIVINIVPEKQNVGPT